MANKKISQLEETISILPDDIFPVVVNPGTIPETKKIKFHELESFLDHGSIAGLLDDDHPQYLLANGSRQLTGNLAVANGITIDGVDVSAHAANASAHHNPVTVLDSSTIDFSLTGQQVSGSVIQSALDHGSIGGLSDDDHTQYFNTTRHTLAVHTGLGLAIASRQIISGNGLTGGGDLSADRTLAVGAGTGISVAADSVAINLAANLTWAGNHVFQGGLNTRHILPETNDAYDLGSNSKLWRKAWLSELDTILFAQNSVTLLGGWLVVSKDEGSLVNDVAAAATKIDFGKAMTVADFVLLRSSNQVEYIQVGTLDSGTTYNVTRNLDGSGANDWAGGTPFVVLGYTGNGRIELNAYDTPRLSIIEQGSAYNSQTELIRLGDLNGNWGYSAAKMGLAIGKYEANKPNMTLDPDLGLRLRIHNTDYIVLDNSGNAIISGKLQLNGTGSALAIGTTPPIANNNGTGLWLDRNGFYSLNNGVQNIKIDSATGIFYAADGGISIDADGISLWGSGVNNDSIAVRWWDNSIGTNLLGGIICDYGGGSALTQIISHTSPSTPWTDGQIHLNAFNDTNDVLLAVRSLFNDVYINSDLLLEKSIELTTQSSRPIYSSTYFKIYSKNKSMYALNQDNLPFVISAAGSAAALQSPLNFYGARACWMAGLDAGTNKFLDFHPNANHLTWNNISGGSYPSYPLVLFAPDFNGSNSVANKAIGGNVSMNNHFSFGAWVYLDSVTRNHGIVRMGSTTVTWSIIYYYNSGAGNGYFEFGYFDTGGTYRILAQVNHNSVGWVFIGAFFQHDGVSSNFASLSVNSTTASKTNSGWNGPRTGSGNFELGCGYLGSYWLDGKIATAWLAGNISSNVPYYYALTRGYFEY